MKAAFLTLAVTVLSFASSAHATTIPVGPPGQTFLRGHARFQVLAPGLVRLEYSPSDACGVDQSKRLAKDGAQSREEDGWFTLSTDVLSLRYKLGSGPFTTNNLRIEWRDGSATHQWKPGDADDQNLGGVPASLDNRSTKAVTDPGPLSRKGCYLLDDSKTALFDQAAEAVAEADDLHAIETERGFSDAADRGI